MRNNDQVLATFDHHSPTLEQIDRILLNRQAIKTAAAVVLSTCPRGADQDTAIRYLHEALMTANKGIANEPPQYVGLGRSMQDVAAAEDKQRYADLGVVGDRGGKAAQR